MIDPLLLAPPTTRPDTPAPSGPDHDRARFGDALDHAMSRRDASARPDRLADTRSEQRPERPASPDETHAPRPERAEGADRVSAARRPDRPDAARHEGVQESDAEPTRPRAEGDRAVTLHPTGAGLSDLLLDPSGAAALAAGAPANALGRDTTSLATFVGSLVALHRPHAPAATPAENASEVAIAAVTAGAEGESTEVADAALSTDTAEAQVPADVTTTTGTPEGAFAEETAASSTESTAEETDASVTDAPTETVVPTAPTPDLADAADGADTAPPADGADTAPPAAGTTARTETSAGAETTTATGAIPTESAPADAPSSAPSGDAALAEPSAPVAPSAPAAADDAGDAATPSPAPTDVANRPAGPSARVLDTPAAQNASDKSAVARLVAEQTTTTSNTQEPVEPLLDVDGVGQPVTNHTIRAGGPAVVREPGVPTPSAMVQRIIQVVSRLENAPPPQRMLLDFVDMDGLQLEVSIKNGSVHVTVKGGEVLATMPTFEQDLGSALSERGFSFAGLTDGDGREDDGQGAAGQQTAEAAAAQAGLAGAQRSSGPRHDDGALRL